MDDICSFLNDAEFEQAIREFPDTKNMIEVFTIPLRFVFTTDNDEDNCRTRVKNVVEIHNEEQESFYKKNHKKDCKSNENNSLEYKIIQYKINTEEEAFYDTDTIIGLYEPMFDEEEAYDKNKSDDGLNADVADEFDDFYNEDKDYIADEFIDFELDKLDDEDYLDSWENIWDDFEVPYNDNSCMKVYVGKKEVLSVALKDGIEIEQILLKTLDNWHDEIIKLQKENEEKARVLDSLEKYDELLLRYYYYFHDNKAFFYAKKLYDSSKLYKKLLMHFYDGLYTPEFESDSKSCKLDRRSKEIML